MKAKCINYIIMLLMLPISHLHAESISNSTRSIPIIYSTDIFHPHADPDDHYDLATLYSMDELDVRGIVLDRGSIIDSRRASQNGEIPVKQLNYLTGRSTPYAHGLKLKLRSMFDKGLDQPEEYQGGVELVLSELKKSKEKVTLFAVGSLRDFAAAYNRQPEMFKEKVKAIYIEAGIWSKNMQRLKNDLLTKDQSEHNVKYDSLAFARLLLSDLPIYWFPVPATQYKLYLNNFHRGLPDNLNKYFEYMYLKSNDDPISFLRKDVEFQKKGMRNMWSTLAFIYISGRGIYKTTKGYEALKRNRMSGELQLDIFNFQPIKLTLDRPKRKNLLTGRVTRREQSNARLCDNIDKVGIRTKLPDGIQDSCVLIQDVPPDTSVVNIMLTDKVYGKTWRLSQAENNERHLAYEKNGTSIIVYFYNPYLAPYHQKFKQYIKLQNKSINNKAKLKKTIKIEYNVNIELDNGSVISRDVFTHYPMVLPVTGMLSELSNTKVLFLNKKYTIKKDKDELDTYQSIMSSCLKNLLTQFPGYDKET
jgi:inosine-uridine nucleoside N-ribohydrolase